MAGPGMSNEMYKNFSRTGKVAYWLLVSLVSSFVIYVWFFQ
jgi:hypothetical protein